MGEKRKNMEDEMSRLVYFSYVNLLLKILTSITAVVMVLIINK